jgi:hypothetical protein
VTVVNDKTSLLITIGCDGGSSDLFYYVGFCLIDSEKLVRPIFLGYITFMRFSFCVSPSCDFVLWHRLHAILFLWVTFM